MYKEPVLRIIEGLHPTLLKLPEGLTLDNDPDKHRMYWGKLETTTRDIFAIINNYTSTNVESRE